MNVTIQNHASYSKRESKNELSIVGTGKDYPEAERYVSLIRDTDDALKDLVSELDQLDRKVLLVFFGDHRPYLSDGFYGDYGLTEDTLEERMEFSKTPYLIWANYDLSETADEDVLDMVGTSGNDTSLNYLSTAAFKLGGIPLSGYQEYLWDLSQEYPVLNRFGAWDKDGNLISVDDYAAYPDLVTYQYIIYNHMFDSKNRLESFFD
jgi:glucan phosphoethanolaminetransferase (alkaline phosphatase superfamily)